MQATHPLPYSILGHYQLLREAGRGGMSVVYEAIDNRIDRRVALKLLLLQAPVGAEAQDARLARFKRESRAIARLSHPNIVTIYDIGEEDAQHFIVMEYLDGETLRERTQQGPIPPSEAAAILRQVASGLDAVHEAGIVHRDIKPSNVMLLPSGLVKLMDFGVARQHEDTMVTQAGAIVGSPVYMSPEQVNGEEHEAASDLWALGVILYEMLAGHAPFGGQTIPNVLYQVAHAAPAPLPDAPPAVQRVLDRALDKNPANRYRSGKEMADAFDAALAPPRPAPAARPTSFAPAPRPPAGSRAGRRIGIAALLLALLTAGLFALAPHRRAVPQRAVSSRQSHRLSPRRHFAAAHSAAAVHAVPARSSVNAHAVPTHSKVTAHAVSMPPVVRPAASPRRMASAYRLHPRRPAESAPQVAAAPRVRPLMEAPPRVRARTAQAAEQVRNSNNVQAAPRVQVSVMSAPPASRPQNISGPDVLGTWHGTNSRNPATLVITHRQGNEFAGTMNVRTHEANVRIAVTGHVSPQTGAITMRETQVISATKPRAWDLGRELGHFYRSGRMTGTSTDVKGRFGAWSFSR